MSGPGNPALSPQPPADFCCQDRLSAWGWVSAPALLAQVLGSTCSREQLYLLEGLLQHHFQLTGPPFFPCLISLTKIALTYKFFHFGALDF